MRRINGTSLSDREWATRLRNSFLEGAEEAGNEFIADWYLTEANELQDFLKEFEDKSISSEVETSDAS